MKRTRNLRKAWPGVALLFAGALFAAGCSTGNSGSGLNLITPGGSHPAGFASTHPSLILSSSDTSLCQPCHGDALDGGIAKVSCFSTSRNGVACHHFSPTWGDPTEHGASAKRAPGNSSFIVCRTCHGNDFSGGGSGVSCFDCHGVSAPHPSRPWIGTSPAVTHTNTDSVNAAVCIDCHAGGANTDPPHPPPTPAAAGTAPGCFNGTLCHNSAVPAGTHATGWLNSDNATGFHGLFVGTITCGNCHPISGHPTCTTCHFNDSGSRVSGSFTHVDPIDNHGGGQVSVGNICENCHQTSRTFRAGSPPSCAAGPGGSAHPGNEGCHSDTVINQTLTNPRF